MGRRFEIACGVALALHAAVVVVAALRSPANAEPRDVEVVVDLDLDTAAVAAPADEPVGPTSREVAGAAPRAALRYVAGVAAVGSATAPSRAEDAIEPSPARPVILAFPPATLDLPRAYTFGGARAEAPAPAASAEAAMRSALDERDRNAGLGRSGPIASAIHAVAGGGRVAPGSTATLVATVDESGAVVGVVVARSSGDAAAWQGVADALLVAMRGKRIAVPRGAHGLRLGFAVESRVRRAGGHMTNGRTPVFVTADDAHASRSPSIALGTPVYRCLEGCTASANLDPTDAVLNATQDDARTIVVESLPVERLP